MFMRIEEFFTLLFFLENKKKTTNQAFILNHI